MNFLISLWISVLKPSKFSSLFQKTTGHGIKYLIILITILVTPILITGVWELNTITNDLRETINNAPDFQFKDQQLEVYGDMPIILHEGNTVVYIDTTENTNANALDEYKNGLIISNKQIIYKKSVAETQIINYEGLGNISFNKEKALNLFSRLNTLMLAGFLIFALLFMITSKLITISISGLLVILLGHIQKHNLSYSEGVKISCYALTLPTMFQIFDQVIYQMPFATLTYYMIFVFYATTYIRLMKSLNNYSNDFIDQTIS